eukprot:gene4444-12880_t
MVWQFLLKIYSVATFVFNVVAAVLLVPYNFFVRRFLSGTGRARDAKGGASSGNSSLPPLPSDPEAAIKRLLQCRDEDFYSILNVTRSSSAAEIKKNYLKQSLRVHPDKHAAGGKLRRDAEEAFKKLSFAHEILGDPEHRRQYEMERSDMAQQQFSEIEEYLRLLKERREQARRNIFCGVCGKQHPKAVMKDKPTHAARWCGSCRVYHPANEGDVWLESKFLGTCQGLDTLEAGSHNVWITLKDSTTGSSAYNASKGGKKNGGGRRGKGDLPRMEDMPDDMSVDQFMRLLMRSAARREAKAKQPPQPPQQKKKGGKGKKKKK